MDGKQVARELLSHWKVVPIRSIVLNNERVGGVLIRVQDKRAGVILRLFIGFLLIIVASIVVLVFLCKARDWLSRIGIKTDMISMHLSL